MKRLVHVLVTTLIGGMVFLIPIVVVTVIIGKALKMTALLARPIAALLPWDSVGGVALASLIALTLIFVICFTAGLATRKSFDLGLTRWLDAKLHDIYPRYTVIKGMAQRFGSDSGQQMKTVLARFDDNAQIAFEIERAENGLVTLFLPGSPDPWSGTVVHMPAERVARLDADFGDVIKSLKGIGTGSAAIVSGSPAAGADRAL